MQARRGGSSMRGVHRSAPFVALLHDDAVRSKHLRHALALHACRVADVFPNVTFEELVRLRGAADLLVVPVDARRSETLERLQSLAGLEGRSRILALSTSQDAGLCLEALRGCEVAGLLIADSSSSHVEFRLNELLDLFPERRRCERASVVLPAEVTTADGRKSCEYAISLSVAGTGLASRRALATNEALEVRLTLASGHEPVEFLGRVIHCVEEASSIPPFRVGVYFLDPAPGKIRRIEAVVAAAV